MDGVTCPFDISDGDPAVRPALDRLVNLSIAKRADLAFALQPLLILVHRSRYIDGEDKLEIDIVFGSDRRCRRGNR